MQGCRRSRKGLGAVGGRGCQLSERGQKGPGRSTPPIPTFLELMEVGDTGGHWTLPLGGSGANPGCTRVRGTETLLGDAHCISASGQGLSHLSQPGQARLECLEAIKSSDATTGTTYHS